MTNEDTPNSLREAAKEKQKQGEKPLEEKIRKVLREEGLI